MLLKGATLQIICAWVRAMPPTTRVACFNKLYHNFVLLVIIFRMHKVHTDITRREINEFYMEFNK